MARKFGLLGTITYDHINYEPGFSWQGVGGILYQAAVFCALGGEVYLYSNLGQQLASEMKRITRNWSTLYDQGINLVPGPGNEVHLYYPPKGERVEILKSVVPPLKPESILKDIHIHQFEMLMAVFNSGFELRLEDWQRIVRNVSCPLWFDVHSLSLSQELNVKRKYVPLVKAKAWIEGVTFIQANAKEAASLLGHPHRQLTSEELLNFGQKAFNLGTKALFVTLGREGVVVITSRGAEKISAVRADRVVDTTGCGDVFGAATAFKLAAGQKPVEAASFGLELAAKAISSRGVEEIYHLIENLKNSDNKM